MRMEHHNFDAGHIPPNELPIYKTVIYNKPLNRDSLVIALVPFASTHTYLLFSSAPGYVTPARLPRPLSQSVNLRPR